MSSACAPPAPCRATDNPATPRTSLRFNSARARTLLLTAMCGPSRSDSRCLCSRDRAIWHHWRGLQEHPEQRCIVTASAKGSEQSKISAVEGANVLRDECVERLCGMLFSGCCICDRMMNTCLRHERLLENFQEGKNHSVNSAAALATWCGGCGTFPYRARAGTAPLAAF